MLELGRDLAVLAVIDTLLPRKAGQAELPVQRCPTLSGSELDSRCRRDRLQRAGSLPDEVEAAETDRGKLASLLWKLGYLEQ